MSDKPQKTRQTNEETKERAVEYRPKTAGGNKNSGPKHTEGQPQQVHKVRPETAAPKQRKDGDHQHKNEDGGKRDNRHRDNKNQKHAEQDVNSWKYKFHNREPKVYPKVVFTETTEIPALPAKEARLKQPTKEDFDAEMAKGAGRDDANLDRIERELCYIGELFLAAVKGSSSKS